MKKQEYCAECHKPLIVSKNREECVDMCDHCWDKHVALCKRLSDREYRMELTRGATLHASNSTKDETRMRCFFAAVMPEIPQHRVDKMFRDKIFKFQH